MYQMQYRKWTVIAANVNKSSEMSFCGKSQMTMFAAKSLHKTFFHMAADFTNPNAITYITEELGFTILGGIRLDGLDRLPLKDL